MKRTCRRLALAALAAGAATLVAACGDGAPQRDGAGRITEAATTRLLTLRAGDCVGNLRESLANPDGGHNGVPEVRAVPCSESHDAEVLRIAPLGDGAWPGFEIVDGEAARGRQALQPRLARAKRAGGPLTLVSYRPTQERWEFEDQHAVMYLALHDRPQRRAAPG